VEWNDYRRLFGASRFQPPSSSERASRCWSRVAVGAVQEEAVGPTSEEAAVRVVPPAESAVLHRPAEELVVTEERSRVAVQGARLPTGPTERPER
jgi:hypothetical protein